MRYFFQYPDATGPDTDMMSSGGIGELARAAEDAGFEGFALTEHPAPSASWLESGGHQTLDPFVALGHAAAVTSRIQLLTYLTVVPYRNPLLLAKSAATVDIVSGGRFVLGIGTGYLKAEYFALGVDFDERNELFDEALEVMPLSWRGEPFSFQGKHFSARNTLVLPRPPQQPIPMWIGGNAPLTMRRVASHAQGWMPMLGSVQLSATTRSPQISSAQDLAQRISELRALAGGRANDIRIVLAYNDPSVHDASADFSRHRDAFAELETAGVDTLVVAGPSDSATTSARRFIDTFARSIF